MSTGTKSPSVGSIQISTLERCLEVLRTSKTDSEHLAALLLVTKCARAQDLEEGTRHKIFDAVGFSLPNRLLFSKTTLDASSDYLLRSLALTLLACFCTDPSIASHPQLIDKIPILNETVNISCQEDAKELKSMIDDAYQCLSGILASPEGVRRLMSADTVPSLCEAYIKRNHGWKNALKVLTSLLTSVPDKFWKKDSGKLQCLLVKLCEDFEREGGSFKFQLAEILPVFLPPSPVLTETSWGKNCLKRITRALFYILRSRLSISQRDPALKLAACLSNIYGSSWIKIDSAEKTLKFFCLLVNLACVEVRMILEDPMSLDSRQIIATACYGLVEIGIQESTRFDGNISLREKQKMQLRRVIREASAAVMHYLQQMGLEKIEDPFTLASIRLLGAWLAKETWQLKQEVIKLLPFLSHYMETWFQRGVTYNSQPKPGSQMELLRSNWGAVWPGDAIRFLLPALCYLTAEDEPRKILISEGVYALLCEYYQQKWDILYEKELPAGEKFEIQLSLESCCVVFFNVVLKEPTFVCQESCFLSIMKHLMKGLPMEPTEECPLNLVANISLLGLMMSHLLAASSVFQESLAQDFFLAAIKFLSRCHVVSSDPDEDQPHIALQEEYAASWEELSEVWFLSLKTFSDCLPLFPWLPSLVITSGWLQDLLHLLDKVSPKSVDSELLSAFQALLTQLAQISVPCRDLILSGGGVEKANVFGMAALEQCLSEMF